MDIRVLEPSYAVSPQIAAEDVAAIAEAGFRTIICNRPDQEITPDLHAAVIAEAAEAAGLRFVVNPVFPGQITEENLDLQSSSMGGEHGPTLAYCASGNRSSIVWSFVRAGDLGVDAVLSATTSVGYQHEPFRAHFEAAAARANAPD